MKTVYFDESGFTGYNLLDCSTPFYILASTTINEADAKIILKETFPKYQQAKEFKSSNIFKSKENKERIVNIFKNIDKSKIYFNILHKEFCIFLKMIDFLIEPIVHDGGCDFYKDGFAYKYANFLYFGFKRYLQNDLFTELLDHYLIFSRNPNHHNLSKLSVFLEKNLNKVSCYIYEAFFFILHRSKEF